MDLPSPLTLYSFWFQLLQECRGASASCVLFISCILPGYEPQIGEIRENVDIGARVPHIDVTQLKPLQVNNDSHFDTSIFAPCKTPMASPAFHWDFQDDVIGYPSENRP